MKPARDRSLPGLLAIVFAAVATLTTACAGSGGGGGGGAPTGCFINRGIRDYDTLDSRNLIIYGPGSQAYHVIMTTPSAGLENEIMIGLLDNDNDGRICPFGGDAILVDGPIRERIPIRSLEPVTADDIEALKVQFGVIEAADDEAVTVTEIL